MDCDGVIDTPLGDWRSAYHICPRCTARAIEKRHPMEWDWAFVRERDSEYSSEAMKTVRVWQFVRDPQFLKTTKYLREGSLNSM